METVQLRECFFLISARCLWAAFALQSSLVCLAQRVPDTLNPDEVIEYFSSLNHGLVERMMDSTTREMLQHVIDNPATYSDAIRRTLQPPDNQSFYRDEQNAKRIGTALGLVKRIGPSHLDDALGEFIVATTERLRKYRVYIKPRTPIEGQPDGSAYKAVLNLRGSALDILADFADARAVNLCLSDLAIEREYLSGADIVMLRYLEKVGALRPEIRPRLEEMYNSPTSPLRNNPQLLRVLDAMDKAAAEQKEQEGNRQDQDRKEE